MIKITDREAGKELTLEECAREHKMEVDAFSRIFVLAAKENFFVEKYDSFWDETTSDVFDSSRFKLEINNEETV